MKDLLTVFYEKLKLIDNIERFFAESDSKQNYDYKCFKNQFVIVFNPMAEKFDFCQGFSDCLGYKDEEILNDPQNYLQLIHPEDLPEVLDLSLAMIAFFSKKLKDPVRNTFSMDYRIKKINGDYIRVLNQFSLLKKEGQLRFISIGHDISHIKNSGPIEHSVAGPDVDLFKKPEIKDDPLQIEMFSKREIEILNLIFQGKNSHEIAQILFISKNTVDTHRRKMLKKAGVASTLDLVKLSMSKKSKSK